MGKSQELYKKAKKLIPGGTQLLSKRPEMFLPDLWPAYYKSAKGCHITDLDDNEYIDMSYMGIGSCILGYADEEVSTAVKNCIDNGSMTTLNAPEEVELAELLIDLHPWADMVRYARTGGEAVNMAVRIARAATKKDVVLFCGYHGWHDWYLAANLSDDKALNTHLLPGLNPLGVPQSLTGTVFPFSYNKTEEFLNLAEQFYGSIAAVVMEPVRNYFPEPGFLEVIRTKCTEMGVVLICDEITAGFRLANGGVHLNFKLEPDMAVFGKGFSNGFPMAAVIGKEKFMTVAQDTFISSTYWTERTGPVAAVSTINKLTRENVPAFLAEAGKKVQEGWKALSVENKLKIKVSGIYPLSGFSFEGEKPLVLKTLFTQEMLDKGFLATTSFYASFAHKNIYIDKYLVAVEETFSFISKALKDGVPEKYLRGPVCHEGFRRLT